MITMDEHTPSSIDKNANTAAYHRPPWMDDKTWQDVSAELTEQWMNLLEHAARDEADQARQRSIG